MLDFLGKGGNVKRKRVDFAAGRGTLLVLVALSMIAGAGPAQAAEHRSWLVARVEGDVRDGVDAVTAGDSLAPGTQVETGANGNLTLIRGRDRIDAGPESRFAVTGDPHSPPDGIMQSIGRMLFDMESRESRDFRVDTPLLAVVIKGTRYSVDVSADGVTVAVQEGTVQVTANRTGEVVLVGPGFTASASAASGALEVRPSETDAGLNDPVNDVTDIGGDLTGTTARTAGSVAGVAGDTVGRAADTVGDTVGNAAASVGDTVGKAADGLGLGGLGKSLP